MADLQLYTEEDDSGKAAMEVGRNDVPVKQSSF